MTTKFFIGQQVLNFGQKAVVINFHHSGMLLLQNAEGLKWLADSQKCELIHDSVSNKTGLTVFN